MKISYINSVCVGNDAISNAIRDEIGFLAKAGLSDLKLFAHACDHSHLPFVSVNRLADVIAHSHLQNSDLVIFHFGIYYPLFNLLPLIPAKTRKLVVFHNITPKALVGKNGWDLIDKSFGQLDNIRWADRVICDSQLNLNVLAEHGLAAKAEVVPLAVHSSLKPPPTKPSFWDDVFRIVFIGRFTRSKGIADLLAAIEHALQTSVLKKHRKVRVDLIGNLRFSDPELVLWTREKIASMLERHARGFEIQLHGDASEEAKIEILSAADLFVLPTYHEGFCVPIVEALGSGCLVIAYENSNTPHICGGFGHLVPTGDTLALVEAIGVAAAQTASPEWRQGSPISGYARYSEQVTRYVEQFSPSAVGEKFIRAVKRTFTYSNSIGVTR